MTSSHMCKPAVISAQYPCTLSDKPRKFASSLKHVRKPYNIEICPEMHVNEMHELYDRHHKVSPTLYFN